MRETLTVMHKMYGLTSSGSLKVWWGSVESDDEFVYVCTNHGGLKEGSKISKSCKKVVVKSQSTPEEQAEFNLRAKYKTKFQANCRDSVLKLEDLPTLPMLAHKYPEKKDKVVWPCYASPKLDGLRGLPKKDKTFTSRTGLPLDISKNYGKAVSRLSDDYVEFDGELYHHDLDFEDICSGVKDKKSKFANLVDPIKYHIFDIVDESVGFGDRYTRLEKLFSNIKDKHLKYLELVPAVLVNNEEELMELHVKWVSMGYEGTMIRDIHGGYVKQYRTLFLLKFKDFIDDEFEVIGGKEGAGADEGTVIWRCITKDGVEFDCTPTGTHAKRSMYYENLPKYIGRKLTVRYQNLTKYGSPRFPSGRHFRPEVDLPH